MQAVDRGERLIAQDFGRARVAADLLGIADKDGALRHHPQIPSTFHPGSKVAGELQAQVPRAMMAVEDEDFRSFRERLAQRLHDEHGRSSRGW